MKTQIFVLFLIVLYLPSLGQNVISGKSEKKKIVLDKEVRKPIGTKLPDLIITGESFQDENGNKFIEAGENCSIMVFVENIGNGVAENVSVKVSTTNSPVKGLEFKPKVELGDIKPNTKREVQIPIKGTMALQSGMAEFNIEVIEERGFDAFPLGFKLETREFEPPKVIVADAEFSTEDGGKIKLNYPIQLKVIVQNIGKGSARDVKTSFQLSNPNCIFLGEENLYNLGNLGRGETKELEFLFTATRRYTDNEIPVSVYLSEAIGRYAHDTILNVGLEQKLSARNQVVISGLETEEAEITIASLSSEVDKNIPRINRKYRNRYALIIGNEDYTKYQRGLSAETNVEFARNDAKIFGKYARNVLGVPEENLYLLEDATAGEMQQKIELISKLASKSGPDSEIIFFYAGHGLPHEVTHEPYLIPVDVSGNNLISAIKLNDIYKKFSNTSAKRVTVLLDACFSGGGRDASLIAARGVKVTPKEESISGNMFVLSASSGQQSALPFRDEQHGMFTFYLLKKLKDSKGNLTYGELADYVTQKVSIKSLKVNLKEQDPKVAVSSNIADEWKEWRFY